MSNFDFSKIDPSNDDHPYDQIRNQVVEAVDHGRLVAGERLPPVRKLADTLGVAVNTVARAYKELEAAGIVSTKGRAGTVVQATRGSVESRVSEAAAEYAGLVRQWGVADAQALEYVRAALERTRG